MTKKNHLIWDGVYRSFEEVRPAGPGFNGPLWLTRSVNAAAESIKNVKDGKPLDYSLRQRASVMCALVGALSAGEEKVRVLDFGGGPGFGYIALSAAVRDVSARCDYEIVDVDQICSAGNDLFGGDGAVRFRTELSADGVFDLVYSASTIQYIDDWQGLVARLASYHAPLMLYSDAFVGAIPSFVTLQHYYDSRIPHRFFNADEFVGEIEHYNYKLALQLDCSVQIRDHVGVLPMSNFPEPYRLRCSSHLLFRKV